MGFRLLATCPATGARAGVLTTTHGDLSTPAFMPVGTAGTVKGLTSADLVGSRARCILANAYHLMLRPGTELIGRLGGLHRFMSWSGPILTDSGGFQVHSLARLSRTTENGVRFVSHLDGEPMELSPESVVQHQELLGSDILMPLDVCAGADASVAETVDGLERTQRWAARSQRARTRIDQQLFGIVQGGLDADLRREAARTLASMDFDGYAIGGLSVGEPRATTDRLVGITAAELPPDKARYLMGVGTPEQIAHYSALGIDMFDCVLPTRFGRTGMAFGAGGRLNLQRSEFKMDSRPIDSTCDCSTCRGFSRSFLHNGVRAAIPLAARLISLHNVRALTRAADAVRSAVLNGTLPPRHDSYSSSKAPLSGAGTSGAL